MAGRLSTAMHLHGLGRAGVKGHGSRDRLQRWGRGRRGLARCVLVSGLAKHSSLRRGPTDGAGRQRGPVTRRRRRRAGS